MKFNSFNQNARPNADVYLIRLVTDGLKRWLEFPISVLLELKIADQISTNSLLNWEKGFIYLEASEDCAKVMDAISLCDDINVLWSTVPHVDPAIRLNPRYNVGLLKFNDGDDISLSFEIKFGRINNDNLICHDHELHSLVCKLGFARNEIKKYMKGLLALKQDDAPFFEAICVARNVYLKDQSNTITAFPVSGVVS
jgi:hypothetical protein